MAEVVRNPDAYSNYRIENGQRYRHFWNMSYCELEPSDPLKTWIPKTEKPIILTTYNDNPTARHLGIAKTTARIALKYYSPGMFRDIANYVRKCESCQKYKASQQAPAGKIALMICDSRKP